MFFVVWNVLLEALMTVWSVSMLQQGGLVGLVDYPDEDSDEDDDTDDHPPLKRARLL